MLQQTKQQTMQTQQRATTSQQRDDGQKIIVYYIESEEKLIQAAKEWASCTELGIDIECENNLHHYGAYISIVQISSSTKNWVVDLIMLKNVKPLVDMLTDENVIKIFHDVSFDFRILQRQLNCKPRNVFDTQVAALLLGKKDIGLGSLLQHYFNVKKESKFQMADWTKRPLTLEMLAYAVKDTNKLIELKSILVKELQSKNRLSWMQEECRIIENSEYEYKEGDFFDIKGISKLSDSERAVFKKMFDIREFLAKKVNRPVHFILSTKKMMELSKVPPSFKEWETMKGVHPIVKAKARLFYEEIEKAKRTILPMPKQGPRKSYNQRQKEEFEKYNVLRDTISERLGLEKHMILSKDQIRDIILNGNMNHLSHWQRELVVEEIKKTQ